MHVFLAGFWPLKGNEKRNEKVMGLSWAAQLPTPDLEARRLRQAEKRAASIWLISALVVRYCVLPFFNPRRSQKSRGETSSKRELRRNTSNLQASIVNFPTVPWAWRPIRLVGRLRPEPPISTVAVYLSFCYCTLLARAFYCFGSSPLPACRPTSRMGRHAQLLPIGTRGSHPGGTNGRLGRTPAPTSGSTLECRIIPTRGLTWLALGNGRSLGRSLDIVATPV